MASTTHHPLQYAPWTSDIELAFYSSLASLKINHDMLNSSARKVRGLYEINHRDAPERSMRMQLHGTALTTDETPQNYYRAEGSIRNFNTLEEFHAVDKLAHIQLAGRTIWDAIRDGSIYSCPSLLSSFSAICFADLKKYKFSYHLAYPALHSDPPWRLLAPEGNAQGGVRRLPARDTEALVDAAQTWRYSVDARQAGFFLAKRVRKEVLDLERQLGRLDGGELQLQESSASASPISPLSSRKSSVSELGYMWSIAPLSSYENGFFDNANEDDRFVCFADPSTYSSGPGWMLRNLLVLVRQRWKLDKVQILCYRDTHLRRDLQNSLIMTVQSAEPVNDLAEERTSSKEVPKVTGWERNEHARIFSRTVDLAAYLDPTKLADQAVDLNLKLIKWRISPSIDLETIKRTSCLLLGAGTLGSYVARNLMGWGVRKITFVDNGRVSYSNPVRQPLYTFQDCLEGGARKAERAAEALRQIYPGVEVEGRVMSVPMAGHPIVDEAKVRKDFEDLKALIENHDAIFLLMDTRESRWLPTVMAKAAGKIVINAALGFDTYMVMRHGLRLRPPTIHPEDRQASEVMVEPMSNEMSPVRSGESGALETNGGAQGASLVSVLTEEENEDKEEVGCYFCSDVVAPADSLKSATLDQQCTVTRPGAAPIASALAVELLVSITQHRLRGRAPAPAPATTHQIQPAPPTDPSLPNSHPLGTVPHQLRGYMSTWQTIQVHGKAYDCCSACSPSILGAYERQGWEFVKRALGEKGYVEEVSGLAEVQRKAEQAEREMESWDDEDDEFDEGEGELV